MFALALQISEDSRKGGGESLLLIEYLKLTPEMAELRPISATTVSISAIAVTQAKSRKRLLWIEKRPFLCLVGMGGCILAIHENMPQSVVFSHQSR